MLGSRNIRQLGSPDVKKLTVRETDINQRITQINISYSPTVMKHKYVPADLTSLPITTTIITGKLANIARR